MMGDTGPCGPCSELHVDLTPEGGTKGSLVNQGDARCIEIWNLVFIQFNANPDGTFSPLPAKHVDTGMGFERVTSIIQGTKGLKDFANAKISNYETDIFRPIFDKLEELSGKKYGSTLPGTTVTATSRGAHAPSRVPDRALAVGTDARHRASSSGTTEAKYSRRNLPHFERPWAKYMVTFSTRERRKLTSPERDVVLKSILYAHEHRQYELYAACVMPDHVHLLFEPQIKEQDKDGNPVFWSPSEILQGIKSASAHNINKAFGQTGHVWEQESMDRMIHGQSDLAEKFHYICRNPWDTGAVQVTEDYPWLWTPGRLEPRAEARAGAVDEASTAAREARALPETAPLKTSGECQGNIVDVPAAGPHPGPASDEDAELGEDSTTPDAQQIQIDIAFRVIADHIRTLSFAIADGIQPGNTDRNYVLRRILRRAVRYGRTLGFREPFFYKLVDVLADTMGDVFPEIRARKKQVQETIRIEEEAFNKTLDKGIEIFETAIHELKTVSEFLSNVPKSLDSISEGLRSAPDTFPVSVIELEGPWAIFINDIEGKLRDMFVESRTDFVLKGGVKPVGIIRTWSERIKALCAPATAEFSALQRTQKSPSEFENSRSKILQELGELKRRISTLVPKASTIFLGDVAFKLYDEQGFPLDLTELMARERGLTVDKEGFEKLMEEQRARARAAQKKEVISLSQIETTAPTHFLGYDHVHTGADVQEVVTLKDKTAVILNNSVCYAEMGGQVGDTGELTGSGRLWRIVNTQKSGNTWLHFIEGGDAPSVGQHVTIQYETARRAAIQRHHTVTHLLHWALHEVASRDASQKGSFVGPDKLTFDFNSAPLTPQQIADIEKLVNERIVENAAVSWTEVPHAEVKNRKDVMQFFGDKYGDIVRVVQIGGHSRQLDGYSMELCGGTHTRATGEIGLFRIVGESAIAAGVRRIEAVAGLEAYDLANSQLQLIRNIAGRINSPVHELEKKVDLLLAHQKELEKSLKSAIQRNAVQTAAWLVTRKHDVNGVPLITQMFPDSDAEYLQAIVDAVKARFQGVVVVGGTMNGAVSLIASVSPEFTAKVQAGKIIQQIAPIVGGKGGGKPDNARGGGKDAGKLEEALAKVKGLLG